MLEDLIDWLERQDPTLTVPFGFGAPGSYRGCYDEVAFEPVENTTFGEMLEHAKSALGATFTGYKGGKFTMYASTDCWIAEHDSCEADTIGPTLKALWLHTAQ